MPMSMLGVLYKARIDGVQHGIVDVASVETSRKKSFRAEKVLQHMCRVGAAAKEVRDQSFL